MKSFWIVFFDLDGTLWDHLDVSSTKPPFTRESSTTISDTNGVKLTLLPGAVDFLKWVRTGGGLVSSCSWNEYDKAFGAIRTFGLEKLFDYQEISTSPNKHLLMEEVLNDLRDKGTVVTDKMMFYIDDRDIHLNEILKRFPGLSFFQIRKRGLTFDDIRKAIAEKVQINE